MRSEARSGQARVRLQCARGRARHRQARILQQSGPEASPLPRRDSDAQTHGGRRLRRKRKPLYPAASLAGVRRRSDTPGGRSARRARRGTASAPCRPPARARHQCPPAQIAGRRLQYPRAARPRPYRRRGDARVPRRPRRMPRPTPGSAQLCELDCESAHTSRCAVNQHAFALLDVQYIINTLERCESGGGDGAGVLEVERLGDRRGVFCPDSNV
jgi:hypothetical protein